MTSQPVGLRQSIRFGEDYELDLRPRRLRRGSHVLRLERIPLELLVLLLERRDEIVTRDQIVSRIWGQGVFLDTDNSIRGAVRKLRQALKDDADAPRRCLKDSQMNGRCTVPAGDHPFPVDGVGPT